MSTETRRDYAHASESALTLSPPAESHLSLLRAYFGFQAYAGVVAAVLIPFSRLLPAGVVTIQGNPLIALPLFAVNVWAAFRTRRLLHERHRDGAWMAGATFLCNLVAARTAGHLGFGVILSGLGVILAANVYRELRRAESAYRVLEGPGRTQ